MTDLAAIREGFDPEEIERLCALYTADGDLTSLCRLLIKRELDAVKGNPDSGFQWMSSERLDTFRADGGGDQFNQMDWGSDSPDGEG